jgi:hypothetical protein
MTKLLAFLVCEKATVDQNGKVTLHKLFDGLSILEPRALALTSFGASRRIREENFFVFYKIVADVPCTIALRVVQPSGGEIQGDWRDSITPPGASPSTWQSIWALTTGLFQETGPYALELMCYGSDSPAGVSLASTQLFVQVAQEVRDD